MMQQKKIENNFVNGNLELQLKPHTQFETLTYIKISKYLHYFDAIIKDDVETVTEILGKADVGEKQMLIHSPFDYEDEDYKDLCKKSTKVVLPFHLAVAFSVKAVAKWLLENKVNQIIHMLFALYFYIFKKRNKSPILFKRFYLGYFDILGTHIFKGKPLFWG